MKSESKKPTIDTGIIDVLELLIAPLKIYHRHETHGILNIPKKGGCIIAVNHSLATYDISLLLYDVYKQRQRIARSLMDRWFFVIPGVRELMLKLGAVEGSPKTAEDLLKKKELICVAPGGMKEAVRSSNEKYQINWQTRKGFAKLAIKSKAVVVLAACPAADDLFSIYESRWTKWFYDNFKVPFVPFRGFGLSILPRPVMLKHFLSEPITPPEVSAEDIKNETEKYQQVVNDFHALLIEKMQVLMKNAVASL